MRQCIFLLSLVDLLTSLCDQSGLLASKAIGPTCVRGQLYGLAAAIGKVGAFIGTYT